MNRQGMHCRLHLMCQRSQNHPVPRQTRSFGEGGTDDNHLKMGFAAFGHIVSTAFIDDIKKQGDEGSVELSHN